MSGKTWYNRMVKVSERHGAGEWALERVALLTLMPLSVWVALSAYHLTGAGYEAVLAWFARPLNAILAGLTVLIFCLFANLAWKVIIEDYIHKPGTRSLLLGLANLVFLVLAAIAILFITRLAVGSDPLSGGFGV